jgi:metallophosphoesterase (TIGR03768 family)
MSLGEHTGLQVKILEGALRPFDFKDEQKTFVHADFKIAHELTRRDFIRCSTGMVGLLSIGVLDAGCAGGGVQNEGFAIDSKVRMTTSRVLSFVMPTKPSGPNSGTGLCPTELSLVPEYSKYGYGNYTYGGGLPVEPRYDIMPSEYSNATPVRLQSLAHFFAFTDIHITDKEAPNQLIYIQQQDSKYGATMTSIYSPVMLYTPHVLDAAIQTINALHEETPFDFGISLGDVCNSAQYNELRWYIDVLDGQLIRPSSGAHLGANNIDYQKPFKAAGLNPSIPWYQVIGNHDHFYMGSIPIDADPTLKLRESYTASNVLCAGDVLIPNTGKFPCLFDTAASLKKSSFYMGVLDGSTPTGSIQYAGAAGAFSSAPTVAADADRRPLLRAEWMEEFFSTGSSPAGHGFNLVDRSLGSDFACYSFVPKASIPLKVIVLDDTQSEADGSRDIHGHGALDTARWNWLQAELAAGQANNQLMIVAAHIPIAVASIGSEMEWWESVKDPNATVQNAVSLTDLVAALQSTPNLLVWIAGHRHQNAVKAFLPPAGGNPENGFWQVETSSLRDFPQQLRTFDLYLNSDYTVSIVTINVDPAVADGTPAAISRSYSIAAQQIVQNDLKVNSPNLQKAYSVIPVDSMDPSRAQDGSTDPTIVYGTIPGVPYCASYNAELFKQLSPTMISILKKQF